MQLLHFCLLSARFSNNSAYNISLLRLELDYRRILSRRTWKTPIPPEHPHQHISTAIMSAPLPKRIMKETERLQNEPVPGISATPRDDNARHFDVMVEGPGGSCYEGEDRHHSIYKAYEQQD